MAAYYFLTGLYDAAKFKCPEVFFPESYAGNKNTSFLTRVMNRIEFTVRKIHEGGRGQKPEEHHIDLHRIHFNHQGIARCIYVVASAFYGLHFFLHETSRSVDHRIIQ